MSPSPDLFKVYYPLRKKAIDCENPTLEPELIVLHLLLKRCVVYTEDTADKETNPGNYSELNIPKTQEARGKTSQRGRRCVRTIVLLKSLGISLD